MDSMFDSTCDSNVFHYEINLVLMLGFSSTLRLDRIDLDKKQIRFVFDMTACSRLA